MKLFSSLLFGVSGGAFSSAITRIGIRFKVLYLVAVVGTTRPGSIAGRRRAPPPPRRNASTPI